jgi:hypothetical protein
MSEATSGWRSLISWTNGVLFASGMVNVAAGTVFAIRGDVEVASLCLAGGLIFLLASTIDRFELLKGFGVEAKTRKLDRKIEEADRAIDGLRKLAEITGAALLDINSKMGRWDAAPGPEQSIHLAERVRGIMEGLESDDRAIAAALRPWAEAMAVDLCCAIVHPVLLALKERERTLGSEISQLKSPRSPEDPEAARILDERRRVADLAGRLNYRQWKLSALPERLQDRVTEASNLLGPGVATEALQQIASFAPDLAALRDSNRLGSAHRWVALIEAHRQS